MAIIFTQGKCEKYIKTASTTKLNLQVTRERNEITDECMQTGRLTWCNRKNDTEISCKQRTLYTC